MYVNSKMEPTTTFLFEKEIIFHNQLNIPRSKVIVVNLSKYLFLLYKQGTSMKL